MKLINLNESVLEALNFFVNNKLLKRTFSKFTLCFVVGSGNAYYTGAILFSGKAVVLADESNFKTIIKSYAPVIKKGLIKQAIIISASGEKDSVWEVELAKKYGLKTSLLTCNANSSAGKIADEVLTYQKIAEPYTYNVSTYLGMILATTREDSKTIIKAVKNLHFPKNFKAYESYSFILLDKFINICSMMDIKKSELFGPHLSLRAFSQGHARHAKFVIPWEKELVISIGSKNKYFGHPKHRWDINLSSSASFATVLSLAYYIIGKIQEAKRPYFKENIENYCNDYGPKAYGKKEPFDIIVPEN